VAALSCIVVYITTRASSPIPHQTLHDTNLWCTLRGHYSLHFLWSHEEAVWCSVDKLFLTFTWCCSRIRMKPIPSQFHHLLKLFLRATVAWRQRWFKRILFLFFCEYRTLWNMWQCLCVLALRFYCMMLYLFYDLHIGSYCAACVCLFLCFALFLSSTSNDRFVDTGSEPCAHWLACGLWNS